MLCQVAGALIRNDRGEFLTVCRLKKPKGIALPSFHLRSGTPTEDKGDIFRRRLNEELSITAINIRRLHEFFLFYHYCRYDFPNFRESMHEWIIFQVLKWENKIKNCSVGKYKDCQWRDRQEIEKLVAQNEFDPIWSKIWEKIKPRN